MNYTVHFDGTVQCHTCGTRYVMHPAEKPTRCRFCGAKFDNGPDVIHHRQMASNGLTWPCTYDSGVGR